MIGEAGRHEVQTQLCGPRGIPPAGAASGQDVHVRGHVRLDHVVIAVSDWERSIAFYRDVLGARVVDHPDGRVAFRFGDQQLNVHGPGLDVGSLVADQRRIRSR